MSQEPSIRADAEDFISNSQARIPLNFHDSHRAYEDLLKAYYTGLATLNTLKEKIPKAIGEESENITKRRINIFNLLSTVAITEQMISSGYYATMVAVLKFNEEILARIIQLRENKEEIPNTLPDREIISQSIKRIYYDVSSVFKVEQSGQLYEYSEGISVDDMKIICPKFDKSKAKGLFALFVVQIYVLANEVSKLIHEINQDKTVLAVVEQMNEIDELFIRLKVWQNIA